MLTDVQHYYLCPYMYILLPVYLLPARLGVLQLRALLNESKVLHVMPCILKMKTFREGQQYREKATYREKANCIGRRPLYREKAN